MKKSNVVRALLVLIAISSPSTAAMYSGVTGSNSRVTVIYAFKPSDVIFPGFERPEFSQRPEGYRGFSGFLQEIRRAVQSTGGAPRTNRVRDTPLAENSVGSQTTDNIYESSIPIQVRNNSRTGDTTEIYLGISVRQILNPILSTETITGKRPANGVRKNRRQGNGLSLASVRGESGSSESNWLSGSLLSTGNSGGISGFGLNLQPLSYPDDLGNEPYFGPQLTDAENTKGLIALRRIVLDLVFIPFVYFSALIVAALMFMARFRSSPA